jgi:hypothetical protein
MPTNITQFQSCIQNLPVRKQAFTTKRSNKKWIYVENRLNWYLNLNNETFTNNTSFTSSRQDLLNINLINREKLLKIIYWGYPEGFQGYANNLNLIQNLDLIATELNRLKLINNLNTNDFLQFHKWTKGIAGLGISTYSKFLYFCEIKFNSIPTIILDKRLMDVFNKGIFFEYQSINKIRPDNAHNKYINYLEVTHELALLMNTNEENIEQFLFIFGNNLK